jgi:hypothetical protein
LACHDVGAVYLGCVCWLPRNIDGVGDNVVQTDRLAYKFSLGAIQCRDNLADDGTPISVDVAPRTGDGGGDGGPTTFPGTQQDKLTATDPEQNDFLDTAVRLTEILRFPEPGARTRTGAKPAPRTCSRGRRPLEPAGQVLRRRRRLD